jgi:L-lactate dehydrogenase complex protein LldG
VNDDRTEDDTTNRWETPFGTLSETRPALPPPWRSRRNFPDLLNRFRGALEAAHGEVVVAESLEAALSEVRELLSRIGAENVVANSEPPLEQLAPNMGDRWTLERAGDHTGDPAGWRELCARADAGITSAEALLAETGSLVVSSGAGKSRVVSLLPPVHVAVVPAELLTADLFTWLAGRSGSWPANTVLISGPSKTADIEQTLSVGVHGPKRLVVVVHD